MESLVLSKLQAKIVRNHLYQKGWTIDKYDESKFGDEVVFQFDKKDLNDIGSALASLKIEEFDVDLTFHKSAGVWINGRHIPHQVLERYHRQHPHAHAHHHK